MTRIEVAEVTSPTHRYNKVRVELEIDGTDPDTLRINDRRGTTLLEVVGTAAPDGTGNYGFLADDGVEYRVAQLSGCGCGGSSVDVL